MKRKLIIILFIVVTIFQNFLPMANAISIEKANLKKDHDINTHIQYYNKKSAEWHDIKCGYINYEYNKNKYPAYCIVPNVHGVDEEGPYEVTITDLLKDKLIYNTIINGYPYKTIEQLGVETKDDAYVATKHAIKSAILGRDVKKFYKGVDAKGQKIVDAIYKISEAGKKGTAVNQDANLKINKVNNLVEKGDYYYQEYKVTSNSPISNYTVADLKKFPAGSYVTDTSGTKKNNFTGNQTFRVMIPKSALNKDILGEINVTASCNTNPVFYGEAPKGDIQNYAVSYQPYAEYTATNTLKQITNTASIKVVKKDEESTKPIEGVTFGLYNESNSLVDTQKTNKDGIAVFQNLYQGKYTIKELKTNEHYLLDESPYEVQAEFNKQIEKVVTNKHKKGNLKIIKVDKDDHSITLGAIEFDLIDSDGKIVAHLVTDVNGEAFIENINTGSYTLRETKTKREYNLCVDEDIVVKWNETSEVTIENEKKKGKIKVVKYDKDYNEIKLAGVKFQVLDHNNRIVEEIVTDSNGEAQTSDLPIGDYYLKEISLGNNSNYLLDEQVYTVKVEDNKVTQISIANEHKKGRLKIYKVDKDNHQIPLAGVKFRVTDEAGHQTIVTTDADGVAELETVRIGKITIQEIETKKEYVLSEENYELEIKYQETSSITIENEKKKGRVEIYKIDSENHKIKIPNVEFVIMDEQNRVVGTMVTDENGYAISDYLPIGKYFIKETKTDSKYILSEETFEINIEEDKIFKLNIENEKQKGRIQIIKRSSNDSPLFNVQKGEYLSGVTFEIYNSNEELVDTIVTNENGQAISKELEIGRYKIIEKSTIPNYLLNTNEFFVNIQKNEQIVILEVENEPIIPEVQIEKVGQQFAEKNEEIKYEFEIANKSNSSLNSFTWKEYLPYEQVKVTKMVTGMYNENINYAIYYKTNKRDYEFFANANTCKSEYLNFDVLNLEKDEVITEIKVEYGTVSSNFQSTVHPVIYVKINDNVKKGDKIINRTEISGSIEDKIVTDKSEFETVVVEKEKLKKLPKTGC